MFVNALFLSGAKRRILPLESKGVAVCGGGILKHRFKKIHLLTLVEPLPLILREDNHSLRSFLK
uniref:Uncharacterized protein n=1 Tax=Candidatus Berkiella cookevillensis TaxID=437022 RepID=A0A0Q9YGW4_9GAMM